MSTLKELCEKHRITLTSSPAARTQWENGTPRFTYQVRLQYGDQDYWTEFHMGVPIPPEAHEVLHDLLTEAQSVNGETFYDWCSNFGYSEDSRKALDTYLSLQRLHIALRNMFSHDLRAELEEAAQNS